VTDLILLRRKFISKTLKEKEVLFGQKERLAKLNERLAKLELSNKESELRKKQLTIQVRRAEKGETDEAKTTREKLTKDLAEVNKHFEECSKLRKDYMYASVKARSVDEITVANAEGDVKMYDAKITELNIKIAKFERDLAENVHKIEDDNKICENLKKKEEELTEKCNNRKREHMTKMARGLKGRTAVQDELKIGDFKGTADELEAYRKRCMAELEDDEGKKRLAMLEEKVANSKKVEKKMSYDLAKVKHEETEIRIAKMKLEEQINQLGLEVDQQRHVGGMDDESLKRGNLMLAADLKQLRDRNEMLKIELENSQESLNRVLKEKDSLDEELKRMEVILGMKTRNTRV